jgi:hAT family C-terminal dimerisation region
MEHHYRVDIFAAAIDQQLQELNARFSEQSTELLTLCAALDPRGDSFSISKVCTLVEKFYHADFSDQERVQLECQLPHFQLDICSHSNLKGLLSLADLTCGLVKTGKASIYPIIDRLLRLVITLPISTATTERAFSVMKLIKTRLRDKMRDDFLRYYMVVYIEKKIAEKFTSNEIINMYDLLDSSRIKLKLREM